MGHYRISMRSCCCPKCVCFPRPTLPLLTIAGVQGPRGQYSLPDVRLELHGLHTPAEHYHTAGVTPFPGGGKFEQIDSAQTKPPLAIAFKPNTLQRDITVEPLHVEFFAMALRRPQGRLASAQSAPEQHQQKSNSAPDEQIVQIKHLNVLFFHTILSLLNNPRCCAFDSAAIQPPTVWASYRRTSA